MVCALGPECGDLNSAGGLTGEQVSNGGGPHASSRTYAARISMLHLCRPGCLPCGPPPSRDRQDIDGEAVGG
jgi:hypothetical protein